MKLKISILVFIYFSSASPYWPQAILLQAYSFNNFTIAPRQMRYNNKLPTLETLCVDWLENGGHRKIYV